MSITGKIRFTALALLLQSLLVHASYNTADRLTDIQEPNRSTSYTLDGVANRITETITDDNQTTTQDKTYSYNSRDQLEQVQDAISAALITYQYDNNSLPRTRSGGNQIQKTDVTGTTNLVYGPRDRLLTITLPGAPPIAYSYNEAGLRDSQSQNGQTLHYIYDQTSLIAETNSINDEIARYTHSSVGPSVGLIAEARSGVQTYLHTDALSTPIAVTDIAGGVTTRYTYDTWGNLQQQTGGTGQPFGFTGFQQDPETGLYYAKQRYYDPFTGRFLREDPFEGTADDPPSLHCYLYARGNPTVFIDPTGEQACLGQALINCPLSQFVPNNRPIPQAVSPNALRGLPELLEVAEDRLDQGGRISLPPPNQVFTENFRFVPEVDSEQPDGVLFYAAFRLDTGAPDFIVPPSFLDLFVANEERFLNVAAASRTLGGTSPANIRVQRFETEFLNRGLLGAPEERSLVGELAGSFGEAARDPFFLLETAASVFGGAAVKVAGTQARNTRFANIIDTETRVARGGVQANRAAGKAAENITEGALRQADDFAGRQVTIETSTGQRTVIDFATRQRGVVETKLNSARLSPGQRQLFDDIQNGRQVTPRGQNAFDAGLKPGQRTTLTGCRIDRICQ